VTAVPSSAPRAGEMNRRFVTGVVLAALGFCCVLYAPLFAVLVLAVALGCVWELDRLSARKGQELVFPVAAAAVTAFIVLAEFGLLHQYERQLVIGTMIGALAVSLYGSRTGYFARSAYTLLSVLYIGQLLSYFVTLRNMPVHGLQFTIGAIILIALTDIFAMLVGSSPLGRSTLTSISPRKTWEGAAGGFAATVIAGGLLAMWPTIHLAWWQGALIGAVTSVAAQAGDLVESALKRDALVKDAGTAFLGHGGWLDRFDSYIFGGVAFYGALWLALHLPGGSGG
jgi:phosphatidate cytidylyltransferase